MSNTLSNNIYYHALLIQKNYRRYYVNKKIKYIYIKLPDDIQYMIKKYMNLDIQYKKFKKNLRNILDKKLYKNIDNIVDNSLITYMMNDNIKIIENSIIRYYFSDRIKLLEYLYYNNNCIIFNIYLYEKYKLLISYDVKNKFNILMFTYSLLFNNLLCSDEYNQYIYAVTNNLFLYNNSNNSNLNHFNDNNIENNSNLNHLNDNNIENSNEIFSNKYKEIIKKLFELYNNYLIKYIIIF